MGLEIADFDEVNAQYMKIESDDPQVNIGTYYSPHSCHLMNEDKSISASIIIDHNMLTPTETEENSLITFRFQNYRDFEQTLLDLIAGRNAQQDQSVFGSLQFGVNNRGAFNEISFVFDKANVAHISTMLTHAKLVGGKNNLKFHESLIEQAEAALKSNQRPRM